MVNKAIMIRKASNLKDWQNVVAMYEMNAGNVIAEKLIIVSEEEYKDLCNDYFKERQYIADKIEEMFYKDETWHCILVTSPNNKKGILIESEGYSYARYTALVNVSDFQIKEVENYE